MRILETDNHEQLSALAAEILGAQVLLKPHCVLGLATGSSPVGWQRPIGLGGWISRKSTR